MNAPDPRSSGVSGSGTLPDQKACSSLPTGSETGTQFCQSHEHSTPAEDNRSYQFRICGQKLRAKKGKAKPWIKMPYSHRSEALATAMRIAEAGIDPQRFLDSKLELRRVGVLLNQVVKLAHQDRVEIDFSERVLAAVKAVEALTS
jgi:hypothetical protein